MNTFVITLLALLISGSTLAQRRDIGPMPGDPAPDFSLSTRNGNKKVTLSKLTDRPTVLIFASYTWGPFRRDVGDIEDWYQNYRDRANFFFVYIREAHPTDGNLGFANVMDGILVEQPKTKEARQEVATMCANNLNLTLPILLDKIDDRTARAYSAFPDRIYVVTADSRVAYKGQPGPRGFDVNEAKHALQTALNGKITKYNEPTTNNRRERGIDRISGRIEGRIGTPGSPPTMGVMDTNQDGSISRNEWRGKIETFERMDRNNDSILSRNEIRLNPREARFQVLDKNNDKQISRNEWNRNAESFEMLDRNTDGFITLEEFRRRPGGGLMLNIKQKDYVISLATLSYPNLKTGAPPQ